MYTVWIDYGMEGWKPKDFETVGELIDFITNGETYNRFRITREMKLFIGEK